MTMLKRLLLALTVLANPAAFPCQYYVIEIDVAACDVPAAAAACCCCDDTAAAGAPGPACLPAGCEPPAGCVPNPEAEQRCCCCIRAPLEPRLSKSWKPRAEKAAPAAKPGLPPAANGSDATGARLRAYAAGGGPQARGAGIRPLQPRLCIWLN